MDIQMNLKVVILKTEPGDLLSFRLEDIADSLDEIFIKEYITDPITKELIKVPYGSLVNYAEHLILNGWNKEDRVVVMIDDKEDTIF